MILLNDKKELFIDCTNHGYFLTLELLPGETLKSESLQHNLLLFTIFGELEITYNEFISHSISTDQVIHFTMSGNILCKAIQNTKIVIFSYSVPRTICDRSSIEDLKQYVTKKKQTLPAISLSDNALIPLFIRDIFRYTEESGFTLYPQLHEIKEKELFILFRTEIQKKHLAELFREIISDSFIFKNKVLQHYTQAKTVQELSSMCGFSPKTFSRIFREHFNNTPYKWLQIQKSKLIPAHISHNPDEPLIIIAENFGFSSLSHFNTFCRKHYNLSAKNFRKKILSEKQDTL